jgi:hypothetical protein
VWQVSTWVQPFPSSHGVVSALVGFEHAPFAGLHVPAVWHWSLGLQTVDVPPVQDPAWQLSLLVQALPSLHVKPFAFGGFVQAFATQMPASWHWSLAVHANGAPPLHAPAWHASFTVQESLSLHVVPSVLMGLLQTPPEHVPALWH